MKSLSDLRKRLDETVAAGGNIVTVYCHDEDGDFVTLLDSTAARLGGKVQTVSALNSGALDKFIEAHRDEVGDENDQEDMDCGPLYGTLDGHMLPHVFNSTVTFTSSESAQQFAAHMCQHEGPFVPGQVYSVEHELGGLNSSLMVS